MDAGEWMRAGNHLGSARPALPQSRFGGGGGGAGGDIVHQPLWQQQSQQPQQLQQLQPQPQPQQQLQPQQHQQLQPQQQRQLQPQHQQQQQEDRCVCLPMLSVRVMPLTLVATRHPPCSAIQSTRSSHPCHPYATAIVTTAAFAAAVCCMNSAGPACYSARFTAAEAEVAGMAVGAGVGAVFDSRASTWASSSATASGSSNKCSCTADIHVCLHVRSALVRHTVETFDVAAG